MALNGFAPVDYSQITAREFAQVALIPTSGSPATLLFTAVGGTSAIVLLTTAAATTNGTATSGSTTLTVVSGTSIAVGQLVYSASGIQQGTTVAAISGTTVTLSQATTAALVAQSCSFITAVTVPTGIAVTPQWPVPLTIGANTFISYISANGGIQSFGGFPSSGFPSVLNVVAGT